MKDDGQLYRIGKRLPFLSFRQTSRPWRLTTEKLIEVTAAIELLNGYVPSLGLRIEIDAKE